MKQIIYMLAALGITVSGPASALTISASYYEDQLEVSCSSASFCDAVFSMSAIAGKFLNIHFVACAGTAPGSITTGSLAISDLPTGAGYRRLQPLGFVGYRGPGSFSVRDQVEYKVTGGSPRHVDVQLGSTAPGSWNLKCTITGELSTQ